VPTNDSPHSPSQPSSTIRALSALGASLGATLLSAAIAGALRTPVDRAGAAVREAALQAPAAVLVAAMLVPMALVVTAERARRIRAWHDASAERARTLLSLGFVAPAFAALWVGLAARAGALFMTAFHHVGLAAFAQSVALLLLTLGLCALCLGASRVFASRLPDDPRATAWGSPLRAWSVGALFAALIVAMGVTTGDIHGRGGLLGGYGVLKKPELDLSPVLTLLGALGLAALIMWSTIKRAVVSGAVLVLSCVAFAVAMRETAQRFERSPAGAVIEGRSGVARVVLRLLRKRTDRDRDGASALFGGGDCDDRDARRFPDARDVPGNGVDEDCSGADAPRVERRVVAAPPPSLQERIAQTLPRDGNLVFITVDTLRWDLHYAGNPRDLSPNLDRLAARSIVFDRAYAMSSYTGRSIGPIMTGRYPSECARDDNHFVRYPDRGNTFLAERLRAAGFHTAAVASHFYFNPRFGLFQGIERVDISATPSGEAGESVSTDAAVTDRALRLLDDAEFTRGRFMLWAHYFDPHKQYVAHPEIPAFSRTERGKYDAEVAWTDRQIGRLLDALANKPFANRTIVVVTADHGEAFGEHGMSWHGMELWEELVRVPWIIFVPSLQPRHIETPRGHIDLLPTVLELLRFSLPAPDAEDFVSGQSLVAEMFGAPATARPVYCDLPEGPYNGARRAMIDWPFKLLFRNARRPELFDLEHDPGERTDLSSTRADVLARERSVYEQLRATLRDVRQIETRGGGS
jgi:arylsulfatase A-like enzyme